MRKLSALLLSAIFLSESAVAQSAYDTQRQLFFSNTAANNSGGMADTLLAMAVASIGSVLPDTCVKQVVLLPGDPPLPLSADLFARASLAYIGLEVQAATLHKEDIEARNATVQTLAQRMKVQVGGDAQKITFSEAKKERQYLFAFTDMRAIMIQPLITGFTEASSQALDETDTPDNTIVCTGTLPAALVAAQNLGIAFQATVGEEPSQTVMNSIGGVVQIVAAQILPLLQTPGGRAIAAQIAADAASNMSTELIQARTNLGVNIADIQSLIEGFDSDLGVPEGSGLAIQQNEVSAQNPNTAPAAGQNPNTAPAAGQNTTATATAAAATTATAAAASGAITVSPSGSNAISKSETGKCGVKSGKSISFIRICANPVQLTELSAQRAKSATTKKALEETTRMVNALNKGNVAAAMVAAKNLGALAAPVTKDKATRLTNANTIRLRSRKPLLDLDGETKKIVSKLTPEIRTEVVKRGGETLLASNSTFSQPQIRIELPEKTDSGFEDLSPRLRGKRMAMAVEAARTDRTTPETATTPVPSKYVPSDVSAKANVSLWEQLTNRYREVSPRFLPPKHE